MKNIIFFLFIFSIFFHSPLYASTYPNSIWSSKRFSETLIGVKMAKLNPENLHILTLSQDKLSIFLKNEEKLNLLDEKKSSFREKWVKLNLFDVNQDGFPEIIISGLRFNRPQTQILSLMNNKIKLIEKLPYFVNVLEWNGKSQLTAQKSFGEELLSGPVYRLEFKENKLVLGEILVSSKNLSVKDFSMYRILSLNLPENPNSFLYLNQDSRFQFYAEEQNQNQKSTYRSTWMSGVSYGGSVEYINRKIRSPLSQEVNERWFIPVSYHSNQFFLDQNYIKVSHKENNNKYLKNKIIYIMKNEGYLKQLSGAVPAIKYSQMTALTWTGYGFQEVWTSARLDGAITDFTLVDWDDDGREELLVSFLLRDKGYFDTLRKQDSILMVMKPTYSEIYGE